MRQPRYLLLLLPLIWSFQLAAAEFTRGEVLVFGERQSGTENDGNTLYVSSIRVHGRDGVLKRELISAPDPLHYSEPLYRDGLVYAYRNICCPYHIERIDVNGGLLTPFATAVNVGWLSPGPAGGLLAVNGSREIYQFAADGTLLTFRDLDQRPSGGGGIDLASDQCTVYWTAGGSLVRWETCRNKQPEIFGPHLAASSRAFRILPDGTFLESVISLFPGTGNNTVIHVDRDGNLIRSYNIPGFALALDIDGTSFWTNVGPTLVRVNIATGAVISVTHTDSVIYGLGVVGEPRAGFAHALVGNADIPTASSALILVLIVSLTAAAVLRLRAS